MKKKIYYGWWNVGAAFLTLFVCGGIGFSTFPVFLKYLADDMQWSRTSLSVASAIAALAAGFITPVVGGVIDRYGIRRVMLPGAALLAAAYLMLSRINSIYHLYALNLLVGAGLAATTILPSQTLVSRWFERQRGRAMGIVTTAGALGSMLWLPVSNKFIESYGWRTAYGIMGVIIGVVSLPLIYFVIRNSPESMGIRVDEHLAPPSDSAPSKRGPFRSGNEMGYSLREALGTGTFWLIVTATFFVVFASSGFGLHVIPFLSDSGLTPGYAAGIWAIVQGVSIVSRFLFGYLSERYQKRYFAAAANLSRVVSLSVLVLFAVSVAPLAAALALLVVIYGAGMGCNAVINPLIISESFGVKNFGKIMGFLGIPYTIGMALGMTMGGVLFDLENNYILAFGIFAVMFLIAGIAIAFAKPCFLLDMQGLRAADAQAGREIGGEAFEKRLPLSEEVE